MYHGYIAVLLSLALAGCASVPIPETVAELIDRPDQTVEYYAAQKAAALEKVMQRDPATGQQAFVGESDYVILSDFEFTPNELVFKAGSIVRVRLSNTALVTHYFGGKRFFRLGAEPVNLLGALVPAGQHHIPVNPLTERDIYLFIKDPGVYPLDCFVPNHRLEGMVGQIKVEAVEEE